MYTVKIKVILNNIKTSENITNIFEKRNSQQSVDIHGININSTACLIFVPT